MSKNYIPSQKRWQKVINKLYSVFPLTLEDGAGLDMGESKVNGFRHRCGTFHCVGGWYAIASEKENVFSGERFFGYSHGTWAMAKDLGFSTADDLELWAHYNPDLWGNDQGGNMFYFAAAYGKSQPTFEDIIHHFEKVADNCKNAEL